MRNLIFCLSFLTACTTEADRNTINCERIPEGASLDEALEIMGEPVFRSMPEGFPDERLVPGYRSAFGASGAIEVILLNKDGSGHTVTHKWCYGTP